MISQKYRNAFKEVLVILKYIPEDEKARIPEEKIEFLKRNQNLDYNFNFDCSIAIEKQSISREANAIILNLINDYFLNDDKKEKLAKILEFNEKKYQEILRKKYDPNNLFKTKVINNNRDITYENKAIVKYEKIGFIKKILLKIKNIFNKK